MTPSFDESLVTVRGNQSLNYNILSIVQSLKGRKRKNSTNLEEGLKICIQGQFFVPNKTGRGTRSIFKCTPSKNAFFKKKNL